MASLNFFIFLSSLLLTSLCTISATVEDDRKIYIVYMGAVPSDIDYSPMSHHQNILQKVTGLNSIEDNSLIRSYGRSFNGFAAKLTEVEREKLAGMDGVISIFQNVKLELQTTRSWDFMGFNDKIKHNPQVESNTIVGVIDSGLWPESKSFTDEGFNPPPKKWKGICKGGLNFTCNNKMIGARYYIGDSARDGVGHGTHTASTAAGNKVDDVSFYGLAKGIARGGVPSARIAIYKVCETEACNADGILAAFDDAIADGVDVITISIGGSPVPIRNDPISIGAFHAMVNGILTVNSAGNNGPLPQSVGSISPWVLTVAASSTDRTFITKVVLGNNKEIIGRSINAFNLNGTQFPLSYGETDSARCSEEDTRSCIMDCIDNSIEGKILVCGYPIDYDPTFYGAVGVIIQGKVSNPTITSSPQSVLAQDEFESLISYIKSERNPKGTILKSEIAKDTTAPTVASFSSRGPNVILGDILKPDITAPGVNILAAYSPIAPIVPGRDDERSVGYSILSGTSMSCPHVAGIAAYVKTLHPEWSPSAIKSAIMTTAWTMNTSSIEQDVFQYGSGHINPTKVADPGLVYDTTSEDYLKMLCAANYTESDLKVIAGVNTTCPKGSNLLVKDLNYPSMTLQFDLHSSKPSEVTFSRTVTNVGKKNATYKAQVMTSSSGSKLRIKVEPDSLSFNSLGEKKSFKVIVSGISPRSDFDSASLVWSDGFHIVRSPIVLYS